MDELFLREEKVVCFVHVDVVDTHEIVFSLLLKLALLNVDVTRNELLRCQELVHITVVMEASLIVEVNHASSVANR